MVATKVLYASRLQNPQAILRFQQEAQIAAHLNHPCIVALHDFGVSPDGEPYLVMDYIEGATLADKIAKEGQLPVDETIHMVTWICDGLNHAHKHNVLHRDLKPSNIMLTETGQGLQSISILDFGIAKILQTSDGKPQHLTQTGEIIGSPFYMSPEQALGKAVDSRSDLYSLGCTMYEALTGGPPHIGENTMSTLLKRETDRPLRMDEASLGRLFSEELEGIVARLLKRNPKERYQTALDLKEDLVQLLEDNPSASRLHQEISAKRKPVTKARTIKRFSILGATLLVVASLIAYRFFHGQHNARPFLGASAPPPPNDAKPMAVTHFDGLIDGMVRQAERLETKQEYPQAIKTYKTAIALYEKKFGQNCFGIANYLDELSRTYWLAHMPAEELMTRERALAIYRTGLDPDDPALRENLFSLADCYAERHNEDVASLSRAISLYREACNNALDLPNERALLTARELRKCALKLEELNYFLKNKEAYETAWSLFTQTRGPLAPQALDVGWRLAQSYRMAGEFDKAYECDKLILDACLSAPHVRLSDLYYAYNDIARDFTNDVSTETNKERHEMAIAYFHKCLDLCQAHPKELQNSIPATLLNLSNMESLMVSRGVPGHSFENCKRYLARSIELLKKSEPQDLQLAGIYLAQGDVYRQLGETEQANQSYSLAREAIQETIEAYKRSTKPNPLDLFAARLNVARTYSLSGQCAKAEALLKDLENGSRNQPGVDSPAYLQLKATLAECYCLEISYSEYPRTQKEVVALTEKLYGPDDARTKVAKAMSASAIAVLDALSKAAAHHK